MSSSLGPDKRSFDGTDDHLDDRELLRRLADDPSAFERFYRRHIDRVIRFVARRCTSPHDVADFVASVFVVVMTSARTYDPARGEPVAWLYGIAARLIANTHRRDARERAAMARLSGHRLVASDDLERLEEQLDAHHDTQAMLRALPELGESHREALLLVGADGLTPAEAAGVLGINSAAFRMRLSSARRALRAAMSAESSQLPDALSAETAR